MSWYGKALRMQLLGPLKNHLLGPGLRALGDRQLIISLHGREQGISWKEVFSLAIPFQL
jgi:hypothetical protein